MSFRTSKYISGFSPQNIPGLVVWLDAADSNAVTRSGSAVTYWRDKSPGGIDVSQNTLAAQPTYESNVQNGLPAIRFTTSQMMRSTSNFTVGQAQTWFISFKALATGNIFFVEQGPNTNSSDGQFLYGGNNSLMFMTRSGSSRFIDDPAGRGTTPFSTNVWYVCGFVTSNINTAPTDVYWSINGVPRTCAITGTVAGTATNQLYINNTSRVPGSNHMGEIIIYNQALPSNQVRQVERYLAQKWGVTLSNTHPYFSVPAALRPFNPLDISGLATWFDAADVRRMTLSGSNVNSWGDKANMDNSMNFVGTAGTLVSNSTNYPCVRFSGTSRYQSTQSNLTRANYFSDTSTCTTFAVVNTSSTSGVNGLFWNFVSTTNTANRVAFFTNPPSTLFWDAGGIASPRQTGLTLVTNSMRIYMFQRAGITLNFRQFGALTTTTFATSTPTIANEQYRITMSESGAAWTGDIHEILWYNRALRDTEIWQVENYFADKWGLRASLTSNSPMRFYASLSPAFNPTLIPGCTLWLDAADPARITLSGSSVTTWGDKSGNGTNATTLSSNPTYSSDSVVYNGAQGLATTLPSSNAESGFIVASFTNVTNGNSMLCGPTFGGRQFRVAGGTIQTVRQGVANVLTSGSALANNTQYLLEYTNNATTLTHFLNGSTYASGAAQAYNTAVATNIGGLAESMVGSLREVVIFNRAVTLQERQQMEGYLARKWGLVGSLPANHPYYTIPV
jgi:hypothetical protein